MPFFLRTLVLVLFLAASCGRWEPGEYTPGGSSGPPGGGSQTPGGSDKDNDKDPDSSKPCSEDLDGFDTFLPLALSEIRLGESGFLEFVNTSDPESDTDLAEIELLGSLTIDLDGTLGSGRRLLAKGDIPLSGEVAIASATRLNQYVCWGQQPPSELQNEAILAGIWIGPCILPPSTALSLHLNGQGFLAGDWSAGTPSPNHCP